MAPSPYCCPSPPRPACAQPRQSTNGPGKKYGPQKRYPRPKGRYDTLCPFSRPHERSGCAWHPRRNLLNLEFVVPPDGTGGREDASTHANVTPGAVVVTCMRTTCSPHGRLDPLCYSARIEEPRVVHAFPELVYAYTHATLGK